jgi:hypothetical protein
MLRDSLKNENIEHSKENTENFKIRNLDSGETYDIRNNEDYLKFETEISSMNRHSLQKLNYMIGNKKIKEKINLNLFKACESGDLEKINFLLNKKTSNDRIPDKNEKYLHDFTVLHIAITNRKYFLHFICNFRTFRYS